MRTDNSKSVTKNNPAIIEKNKRPLLRYGVNETKNVLQQSFIACLADIYTYNHPEFNPTLENMRNEIIKSLTLDTFIRAHNGSLVSIFQPKMHNVSDTDIIKYENTQFYKSFTRPAIISQDRFLKDTIASYKNFIKYINDKDSIIDHTYLWDIITSADLSADGLGLFGGNINLVIMEVLNNDMTDNIAILCPSNSYKNRVYDPENGTIILLKTNDMYEPIYAYVNMTNNKTNSTYPAIKIFKPKDQ